MGGHRRIRPGGCLLEKPGKVAELMEKGGATILQVLSNDIARPLSVLLVSSDSCMYHLVALQMIHLRLMRLAFINAAFVP